MPFAPPRPEPGQRHGGAQLEAPGPLPARDLDRGAQVRLDLGGIGPAFGMFHLAKTRSASASQTSSPFARATRTASAAAASAASASPLAPSARAR